MKKLVVGVLILAVSLLAMSSSCKKELVTGKTPGQMIGDEKPDPKPDDKPSQDGIVSLNGKKIMVIGNSMVYYGGCVQNGSQKNPDPGLLSQLIKAYSETATVYDCTYGGHALHDFTSKGCVSSKLHGDAGTTSSGNCPGLGTELLPTSVIPSVDYVFISEAGDNNSLFYTDATAVFKRFKDANPNVKCFYINHIYSVYKTHTNVTSNLSRLHADGVTIINCGQLAYDIYTGRVKVPGGNMSYSDRYTFCNHTSSDTYHPNPLMGYIMSQMCYCALTGREPFFENYSSLIKGSYYGGGGSVSYSNYYNKYYTTAAAHPFMDVIDNKAEMRGIQELIPSYINKY